MAIRDVLHVAGAGLLALALGGCWRADVTIPDYGGSGPAPGLQVAPANPNSKADLLRENHELRAANQWLRDQNAKDSRSYDKMAREKQEIQAEIQRARSQRDRYRSAAGEGRS